MAPPSAAMALRESFGDRKLPDITRKITACVACRKLKIKCHMNESKPPCSRCKARRLPCTVNKSIQMLLENDLMWKEVMEQRISVIEESLIPGRSRNPSTSSTDFAVLEPPPSKGLGRAITPAQTRVTSSQELPAPSDDKSLNLSCSLGAFPASSMNNHIVYRQDADPGYEQDLISRGLIAQDTAEEMFMFYQKKLDSSIHNVLADMNSLADVRSRSSLLTAAVITSAAFCTGSKDYQIYLDAFKHEVSGKMFSMHPTFDDVRASCIGAFWLNDVSTALNALAVRMAAELDLHRCITKMPHTKMDCYERTRLYFLVYLCDHHCSLSHGRPPMTRESRSLRPSRALLRSEFSVPSDLILVSQVELWSISSRVFDTFGADIGSSLVRNRYADLENLSTAYDRWRREWLEVLTLRHSLDGVIRHLFDLYLHSAKLYLFSHVFRGNSQGHPKTLANANGTDRFASCAVENALSIIRCVTDETEAQEWLGKLPSYLGTTIAFASIFLLRASWQEENIYNVDKDEVLQYLRRLTELLHGSSTVFHPTNILLSLANSLDLAIGGRCQTSHKTIDGNDGHGFTDPPFDFDIFGQDVFNLNSPEDHDTWMTFPDSADSAFPPITNLEATFIQW